MAVPMTLMTVLCPECGETAAQRDETAPTGFSAADRRGKVIKRGKSNVVSVLCWRCGKRWDLGIFLQTHLVPEEMTDGELLPDVRGDTPVS